MLHAKLEMSMLKAKTEKLHLNQTHDKKSLKGSNSSFEMQAKKHVIQGFINELQLIGSILTIGKEHCKAVDVTLKSAQIEKMRYYLKHFLEGNTSLFIESDTIFCIWS